MKLPKVGLILVGAALAQNGSRPYLTEPQVETLQEIRILSPVPLSGGWVGGHTMRISAEIAKDIINSQQKILPGYYLNVTWLDDRCEASYGQRIMLEKWMDDTSWVALGANGCSAVCMATADIAPTLRIPQISYGCASGSISNTAKYPDITRFMVVEDSMADVFNSLGTEFGWTRISIITGNPKRFDAPAERLEKYFQKEDRPINAEWLTPRNPSWNELLGLMEKVKKSQQRAIVVLGYEPFYRMVVCAAYKVGIPKGIVWLSVGWHKNGWWNEYDDSMMNVKTGFAPDCTSTIIGEYYEGGIGASGLGKPQASEMGNPLPCFDNQYTNLELREIIAHYFAVGYPVGEHKISGEPYWDILGNGPDGMCVWAYMVRHMLQKNYSLADLQRPDREVYRQMVDYIKNGLSFFGVSGNVDFVGNDLPGILAVYQVQRSASNKLEKTLVATVDFEGTLANIEGKRMVWGNDTSPGSSFDACPNSAEVMKSNGECEGCAAGKYLQSKDDIRECVECPEGKATNVSGAVGEEGCAPCTPGTFASEPGSSSCRGCHAGKFNELPGLSVCKDCASGTYSGSGATICIACPRGSYAIQFGTTECTSCGADFSTPFPGATSSKFCGCPKGRYLPMPPGAVAADTFEAPANGSCAECPWGMDCLGFFPGADASDALDASVLPGHHRQPRTKKRFFAIASEPYEAFMCRSPKWCPGDRLPGDTCAKNRQYFGCGACEYYYVEEKSGDCRKCSSTDSTAFTCIAILFISLLPLVVYSSYDVNLSHAIQSPKHVALSSGHIFVYFLEACAIMGDMNIKWPYPVDNMLSYSSVFSFNLDVLAPACALGKGYQFEGKYAISVSIPFMIGSYLGVLLLLSMLIRRIKRLNSTWRKRGLRFERTVSAFGIIYVALYVAACRATLRVFECFKVRPDGRRQLSAYSYIECFSNRWWSMFPLGVFAFLVYGAATFAGAIFLCSIAPRRFMNNDSRFCKCFGFLFHEYRRDCWWWLPIILVRNLSLPMALVISPGDGQAQAAILFFLNLIYLIALLSFWPWLTHSINVTDLLTMGVGLLLLCSLTSSFMDETSDEPNKALYAVLMTTTLVFALVTLGSLWGGNMARHLLTKFTGIKASGCLSTESSLFTSMISNYELAFFLLQVSEELLQIGKDDAGKSIAHMNYTDRQTIKNFVAIGLTEFCQANSTVSGLPQRLVVGDALMIALDSRRRSLQSLQQGPDDPLHMHISQESPDVLTFMPQASESEVVVPNETFEYGNGVDQAAVTMESAFKVPPCAEFDEESDWPRDIDWSQWPDRPEENSEAPSDMVLAVGRPQLCPANPHG